MGRKRFSAKYIVEVAEVQEVPEGCDEGDPKEEGCRRNSGERKPSLFLLHNFG